MTFGLLRDEENPIPALFKLDTLVTTNLKADYISIILEIWTIHAYNETMDHKIIIKRLGELGHATRMSIFRLLVKYGDKGLPVGEIQKILDVPAPTLSHHLSRLVNAGLIVQHRDGRTLYCVAQMGALREVIDFLDTECCTL